MSETEKTVVDETAVSKSKQKREARKQEVKAEKAKKNIDNVITWVVGILIAAVVIGTIVMGIVKSTGGTVASSDFSAGITAEGYIAKANLDKVKKYDFSDMVVPFSEVEFTDEDVQKEVDELLSSHKYYSDAANLTTASGDTINLDYVGYVDGVAFDGGNTNGSGTTLTLGSKSYIDDFEDQLVGYHPGDSVTVEVTFPDDYGNEDLKGKDATFECVINSIQVTPEFTDEFVVANYADSASTTEELKAVIKKNGYDNNLSSYITKQIEENVDVTSVPSSYAKQIRSILKYGDEQTYNYYNQYFTAYFGYTMYNSFNDYTGMTDSEYEAHLKDESKKQAKVDMTYEKMYKNYGLSIDEYYDDILAAYGANSIATYGEPYIKQSAIKYAVIAYLADVVTVQ